MHSQSELRGWKAKWNSIHKHEWWILSVFPSKSVGYDWKCTATFMVKIPTFNLKPNHIKKMLLRLNMHVTSEIPLNLANKMNLEQKQWLQLQARRLIFCLGGFFVALKGPLILTVSHKIKLIAEDFPVEVDGCVILMPSSMRIWIAPYNRVVIQRLLILKLPSILSFYSRHICNTSVTFSQLRFQ